MKILGLSSEVTLDGEQGVVCSISREWIRIKTANASLVVFLSEVVLALTNGKLKVNKV